MNGQGAGAETIPFSVAVKAQGNIEDWLCDLLFKMQVVWHELTLGFRLAIPPKQITRDKSFGTPFQGCKNAKALYAGAHQLSRRGGATISLGR